MKNHLTLVVSRQILFGSSKLCLHQYRLSYLSVNCAYCYRFDLNFKSILLIVYYVSIFFLYRYLTPRLNVIASSIYKKKLL